MPIIIERGHPLDPARASARGSGHQRADRASVALDRRNQVHKELLADDKQHKQRMRCSGNSDTIVAAAGMSRPLLRAAKTRSVWLPSIMSMIFIAMLATDCQARAFLGNDNSGVGVGGLSSGEGNNFMQQVTGDKYMAPSGSALEFALEASCRNLVESILYPRAANRDGRSIVDLLDYADVVKRASPKHTPRFGRR